MRSAALVFSFLLFSAGGCLPPVDSSAPDNGGDSSGSNGSGGTTSPNGPEGPGGGVEPEDPDLAIGAAPDGGGVADGSVTPPLVQGCSGVTAAFCEDFEAQADGQEPAGNGKFTVDKLRGTLLVDSTRAYSGSKSIHVKMVKPSGDSKAQLKFDSQFPLPSNDLHGRAMVFLAQNPADTLHDLHWDLTTAFASPNIEYTLGSMYNDGAKTGAFMPVYQPGDDSVDTRTPFPENKWACIQWEFKYGGAGGDFLEVKMNGQLIDQGHVTGGPGVKTWKAGAWRELNFGWIAFQDSNLDVDLWFDDLAFGEQEIPCPK